MAASSSSQMVVALLSLSIPLSLLLLLPYSSLASPVICEELPPELCSFAVSGSSKRCVLENFPDRGGRATEYRCLTSEVVAEKMSNWIETDECITSCGVDRKSVSVASTDFLHEPQLTAKLCSPACYNNCINIVHLYFYAVAGEGIFLPDLCKAQRANPRRFMAEEGGSPASAPSTNPHRGMEENSDSPAPAPGR